jgi:hypothetical protein
MDLEELMANALCLGVNVTLEDCGDAVHIGGFARTTGAPGAGATVMQSICEYADRESVELILGAHRAEPKLVAYYRQFGFEADHHQGGMHHSMVRFPQEDEA